MGKRPGKILKNMAEVSALSKEEIEEINSVRSPSERLANWVDRCGSKTKKDPERPDKSPTCLQPAGQGTSHPGIGHCKFHGGNTPAGNKHAARLYAQTISASQKQKFGGDRDLVEVNPEQALIEEVRRSVAMVRWLEERIGEWQYEAAPIDEKADWPLTRLGGLPQLIDETSRGASSFTDEREWLLLYREERTHSARVSKMAIDAGLAERMVRLAEDQGRLLASAIHAILDALQLTPDQLILVPQVVPSILRQASQGSISPSIQGELIEA